MGNPKRTYGIKIVTSHGEFLMDWSAETPPAVNGSVKVLLDGTVLFDYVEGFEIRGLELNFDELPTLVMNDGDTFTFDVDFDYEVEHVGSKVKLYVKSMLITAHIADD